VLIALTSARGSPGVTTAGLALALAWQRRVILAELDPAGGEVLAGYGGGRQPAGGLAELLFAARRGGLEQQLWSHLIRLDATGRALLLPGLVDPASARSVGWDRLAAALAGLDEGGTDVLADCGRLRAELYPEPALRRAAAVVVVTGSTLRAVRAAKLAVAELRAMLAETGTGGEALCALLVGPGEPYAEREIGSALGAPVIGVLPRDRKAAAVLSDGAPAGRLFAQSALLRAARTAAIDLAGFASARQDRLAPAAARLPPERARVSGAGGGHGR